MIRLLLSLSFAWLLACEDEFLQEITLRVHNHCDLACELFFFSENRVTRTSLGLLQPHSHRRFTSYQGHLLAIAAPGESSSAFQFIEILSSEAEGGEADAQVFEFHLTPEPILGAEDDLYAQYVSSQGGDCAILRSQSLPRNELAALDARLATDQTRAYDPVATRGWHNLLNETVHLLWFKDDDEEDDEVEVEATVGGPLEGGKADTWRRRLCELEAVISPNGDYGTNTVLGSRWCAIRRPPDDSTGEVLDGGGCCDPSDAQFIEQYEITARQYHHAIDDGSDSVPAAWRRWWHDSREKRVQEYKRTTGRVWIPASETRPSPVLFMWDGGRNHTVRTRFRHFQCIPPASPPSELAHEVCLGEHPASELESEARSLPRSPNSSTGIDPLQLELRVLATEPRIFQIDNFISDAEVEHIVRLSASRMSRSQVGAIGLGDASYSAVRTSRNTWVSRSSSSVTDHIWKRVADLLKIDEALLHPWENSEDMQVSSNSKSGNTDFGSQPGQTRSLVGRGLLVGFKRLVSASASVGCPLFAGTEI